MVFGIPCVNGTLNGFFNVGNKSPYKETVSKISWILSITSCACSKGLVTPNSSDFISNNSSTSFEIVNGLNSPSIKALKQREVLDVNKIQIILEKEKILRAFQ